MYRLILPTCLHAVVVLISTISLASLTLSNSWSIIMAWMIKQVQAYSLTIFVNELLSCVTVHVGSCLTVANRDFQESVIKKAIPLTNITLAVSRTNLWWQ
jgi:hypothetical protein